MGAIKKKQSKYFIYETGWYSAETTSYPSSYHSFSFQQLKYVRQIFGISAKEGIFQLLLRLYIALHVDFGQKNANDSHVLKLNHVCKQKEYVLWTSFLYSLMEWGCDGRQIDAEAVMLDTETSQEDGRVTRKRVCVLDTLKPPYHIPGLFEGYKLPQRHLYLGFFSITLCNLFQISSFKIINLTHSWGY